MPATHSLAQQRAQHALAAITELAAPNAQSYGNYLSYVKALPANVRSLGLGQAMAFALAKCEGDLTKPYGLSKSPLHLAKVNARAWPKPRLRTLAGRALT